MTREKVQDVGKAGQANEQAKNFVKLVKQLDEKKQRALLLIIKGAAVISGVEEDPLI